MTSRSIAQFLVSKRKKLWAFSLIFLAISITSFLSLRIDGSFAGNVVKQSPYYIAAQKVKDIFGMSNTVQLRITPKNNTSLLELGNITESIINRVTTELTEIKADSLFDFKDYFYYEKVEMTDLAIESLEKLKRLPLARDFISIRGGSMQVLFHVPDQFESKKFDAILADYSDQLAGITPFSTFHIEHSVAKFIEKDLTILSTVMIVLSLIVLIIIFKSFHYIFISLGFLGVGIIPCGIAFFVFDTSINIITILTIPILIVLTLSDIIHLLSGLKLAKEPTSLERVRHTIESYVIPSFLTSLTTAIAFLSFSLSTVPNMRQFALVSSLSVMLTYFVTYMMAPYILNKLADFELKNKSSSQSLFLSKLLNALHGVKKAIFGVMIIIVVAGLYLIGELRFKTSSDIFFPKNSDLYQTHEDLKEDFYSLMVLDVLIKPATNPVNIKDFKWDRTALPKEIFILSKKIERLAKVERVTSLGSIMDYFLARGEKVSNLSNLNFKNSYMSGDYQLMKIWFKNADDAIESYPEIQKIFAEHQREIDFEFSSPVLLNDHINSVLSENILSSLITSGLLVLILIYMLSESFRVTMISFCVNIIPLLSIPIIFSLFEFNLNIITSMSIIICLGIIVDDTIHVIFRYKSGMELSHLFYGMLTTSIILIIGFGMFSFSEFIPSQILGMVCSIIFLIAVLADIIVLPWALKLFARDSHVLK